MAPAVIPAAELVALRNEADRVAIGAGSVCVRRLVARSGVFARLAIDPRLTQLLPGDHRLVRSILFDKTPERNWPVAWHQDLTITVRKKVDCPGYGPWSEKDGVMHVQPPAELLARMVTLRLHLDDTDTSNGALKVIPGSHRAGRLDAEAVREWTRQPPRVCTCAAGDVVLMAPLTLHASDRATTPHRRRVLHFEYAPTDSLHPALAWGEA